MAIISLALKSLRNRRVTIGLTILSIALSVALFLGVERLRHETRNGFTNTISGTDLIVGARTSPVQLLLASVFRLGDMSNNINHHSYEAIAALPEVKWAIPLSLGDTHKGFRVLGTNSNYYTHLQFGSKQHLSLEKGDWFEDTSGAVLGAEVADKLGYRIGSSIVVSHGSGEISFVDHDNHPFTVTGVLERTGTPVDQTVHVSLGGIDAIHAEINPGESHRYDPLAEHLGHDNNTKLGEGKSPSISAMFLGLQSRRGVLTVQRTLNDYPGEPLSAVIPAVALQELWEIVGTVEKSLLAVSAFVVLVGMTGMMVAIMTNLQERRREMAILRAVGARPVHVFAMIVGEAAFVTIAGVALGVVVFYVLLLLAQPVISSYFGLFITVGAPSLNEIVVILIMCLLGTTIGFIPGYRVYRYSLADGMTIRM